MIQGPKNYPCPGRLHTWYNGGMKRQVIACFAAALAAAGCRSVTEKAEPETPRILAHRGGRAEYGDNALGAFRQSLEYGITGFETDVRATKDGALVIMHDADIARTTTGSGRVDRITLAEFKALALKSDGEPPPALDDVLGVLGGRPGLWVEFEMKSADPLSAEAYCEKLHAAVSAKMAPGTYAFTSFNTNLLAVMHALHPDAKTSYIMYDALASNHVAVARSIGATGVSPLFHLGGRATTREAVAHAHETGMRVALWMCEDGATYRQARLLGADTVTSDNPILVRDAMLVADAKAADPMLNTALFPVAKLQQDGYQWFDRHRKVMAEKDAIDPEIVFVGDSITHFWAGVVSVGRADDPDTTARWKKAFGKWRTLNLGYGWDRTGNVFKRLDMGEMDGLSPKLIVVHVGGNNFTTTSNYRGNTPEEVAAADVALVKRLHAKCPGAHVAVMAIFPFGEKPGPGHRTQHPIANEILAREMAKLDYVSYFDITSKQLLPDGTYPKALAGDFCHPTDAGYDVWAAALAPALEKAGLK